MFGFRQLVRSLQVRCFGFFFLGERGGRVGLMFWVWTTCSLTDWSRSVFLVPSCLSRYEQRCFAVSNRVCKQTNKLIVLSVETKIQRLYYWLVSLEIACYVINNSWLIFI